MKASVWIRVALCLGALTSAVHSARADTGYGLGVITGGAQALVPFDTANLAAVTTPVTITGLTGTLVDIDYYPVNGGLYGLSTNGALYRINTTTGVATVAVAANGTIANATNIDFNPSADRLRVYVGSASFRLTPDTFDNAGLTAGALTSDGNLTFDPATTVPGAATTDRIGSNAYTNNFNGTATTALYSLDITTGQLLANSTGSGDATGSFLRLAAIGATGALGGAFTALSTDNVGFDISQSSGTAFASVGNSLYTINLTTGGSTLLGSFATGVATVSTIAVTAVPEPSTYAMLGLGAGALAFGMMRRRKAGALA